MLKSSIIGVVGTAYIATTTSIHVSDITRSRIPRAGRVFIAIARCHCGGSTFDSTTVDVVFAVVEGVAAGIAGIYILAPEWT